jgi:3-dehydroquinate synthase
VKRLQVALGDRSHPVLVGAGLLARLGALVQEHGLSAPLAIVTDENVARLHGGTARAGLAAAGLDAPVCALAPGESSKTLVGAARAWRFLAASGIDRRGTVIALGGGVVGDLAGFAAATWLRGVALVQAPTTVLAQADSAIGGKVGIDLPEGKNLVGAFHQPRLVVADTGTLATLSAEERRAGLAEVLKAALIRDAAAWQELGRRAEPLLAGEPEALGEAIAAAVAVKAAIVAADEREAGERELLNFGHTLGHALEAALDWRLRHGEAVAIGMAFAARLSERLTGFDGAGEVIATLERFGLPVESPVRDAELLLPFLRRDKKVRAGRLRFVALDRIGSARVVEDVPEPLVRELLALRGD